MPRTTPTSPTREFGDVVTVDSGVPLGSEAETWCLRVIVTADAFLRFRPAALFVVTLTTTRRGFPSHVEIESDRRNGLRQSAGHSLSDSARSRSSAVAPQREMSGCGDALLSQAKSVSASMGVL